MGNVATTRTFKQGLAAVNADFAITIGSSGAAAWNTTARGALPPMIDDVLLRAFVCWRVSCVCTRDGTMEAPFCMWWNMRGGGGQNVVPHFLEQEG